MVTIVHVSCGKVALGLLGTGCKLRKFVITEAGDRILYFLRIYVCRLQRLLRPIGGKETVQSVKVLLPALRGVDSGLLQIVGAHQVLGGLSREGFGNGHRRKKYSDH